MEPARTLSIDTDEGTWISVDVSPDGETIVFDLLATSTTSRSAAATRPR